MIITKTKLKSGLDKVEANLLSVRALTALSVAMDIPVTGIPFPSVSTYGFKFMLSPFLEKANITEGYYEVGMIPTRGPNGEQAIGLRIVTASLSEDEKRLGVARDVRTTESAGMYLQGLASIEQTVQMVTKNKQVTPLDVVGLFPMSTAAELRFLATKEDWVHYFDMFLFDEEDDSNGYTQEFLRLAYPLFREEFPTVFTKEFPKKEEKQSEPPKKSSIILGV